MTIYRRDDFQRTDGELVASGTPTWAGGAGVGTWEKVSGADFVISSGRLAGSEWEVSGFYRFNGAAIPATAIYKWKWYRNSTHSAVIAPAFHTTTNLLDRYSVSYNTGDTNHFVLIRTNNGATTAQNVSLTAVDWNVGIEKALELRITTTASDVKLELFVDGVAQDFDNIGPSYPYWLDTSASRLSSGDLVVLGASNTGLGTYLSEIEVSDETTPTGQFVYPETVASNAGGYTTHADSSANADILAALADGSDQTRDDATYIKSPANPSFGATITIALGSLSSANGTKLRYTYGKDFAGGQTIDQTVELLPPVGNDTQIANFSHMNVGVYPQLAEQDISAYALSGAHRVRLTSIVG